MEVCAGRSVTGDKTTQYGIFENFPASVYGQVRALRAILPARRSGGFITVPPGGPASWHGAAGTRVEAGQIDCPTPRKQTGRRSGPLGLLACLRRLYGERLRVGWHPRAVTAYALLVCVEHKPVIAQELVTADSV